MTVEIAEFDPTEVLEVAELWRDSWLSNDAEHGEGVTVETLTQRLLSENWEIYVARDGRRITALLAMDIEASLLAQLFVAPDRQNRHIGKVLLDFAKAKMPGGLTLNTAIGNTRARRFYERHGLIFDRVEGGKAYYRWDPSAH